MLRILSRKRRSIWNVFREYYALAAVSDAVKKYHTAELGGNEGLV